MKRYVEEADVLRVCGNFIRAHGMNGSKGDDLGNRFRTLLRKSPTAPTLISRKVAAEILGVQSPHIARYEKQGRMPEPIPVEGTAPVYVREEVETLRGKLEREREARRDKKEKA